MRRSTGPHSPAVHSLLVHLENVGFTYSPQFFGTDDSGREVLTYVEGAVGNYPMQQDQRSLTSLDSALAILRELHDATTGVVLPDGHANHRIAGTSAEVVCHWDAAPYNFVFDGPRAVGLIDFDEAGPGRRIDDLAYFAYRFAPLCGDDTLVDGGWSADVDRFGRLERIFATYPDPRAHELPDLIEKRLEEMKRAITARRSMMTFAEAQLAETHLDIYSRDQLFVDEQRRSIINAVR